MVDFKIIQGSGSGLGSGKGAIQVVFVLNIPAAELREDVVEEEASFGIFIESYEVCPTGMTKVFNEEKEFCVEKFGSSLINDDSKPPGCIKNKESGIVEFNESSQGVKRRRTAF